MSGGSKNWWVVRSPCFPRAPNARILFWFRTRSRLNDMLPESLHCCVEMADYYPLIARAIAGLDPSAPGESRRALYERARAALIAQLRSVDPPLSESEITRERLSLEEAVRKVESEAAQRARDATRSGEAARPADASRAGSRPGDS